MEFYSCDTMVALGNSTRSGNILFAKNSDRPVNEAQPLVLFEAADHAPGEELKCTYITIPQVEHTYRVMGSQPYWLWGFEHGMNEHKVVIGNEAVWSKEEEETENGLIGMDLLRLEMCIRDSCGPVRFTSMNPWSSGGNGTDCLPVPTNPCIWNWAAEKAAFWQSWLCGTRRSTMWAST